MGDSHSQRPRPASRADSPDCQATAREHLRSLSRTDITARQLEKLGTLLREVLPSNRFYARKLAAFDRVPPCLDEFASYPCTTKEELSQAAADDPEMLLTYSRDRYVQTHRTSGTTGAPLYVHDTSDDWSWWTESWQHVLDAANVSSSDVALMACSFGPFIGFWSARDALLHRGTRIIPTGGMSSIGRLDCLRDVGATIVCCTPTYALRLAEVAEERCIDLRGLPVRTLIVAGEPGGSVPAIRDRIADAWGADVVDHAGATEVGPWGYSNAERTGLHILETEFLAEFLPLEVSLAGQEGRAYELVLTPLGRTGFPVIRYRTGDVVRPRDLEPLGGRATCDGFVCLIGGILGRADDMLTVRGVNVFPGAIEAIVRTVEPLGEFRIQRESRGPLQEVRVVVETEDHRAAQIADLLERSFSLRIPVDPLSRGSLPKFEDKSRRW